MDGWYDGRLLTEWGSCRREAAMGDGGRVRAESIRSLDTTEQQRLVAGDESVALPAPLVVFELLNC